MFGGGGRWLRFSERFKFLSTSFSTNSKTSSFCNSAKNNTNNNVTDERYRQLENLDMVTAAKILFTDPPKKKFGFDFHVVQFFFVCLPSLAVYLVAQYARYDIKEMEAVRFLSLVLEVEEKRKLKKEEEATEKEKEEEKEMELNPKEKTDPQLSKVKERLEKLEEVVNEIVVENKTQLNSKNLANNQVTDDEKKHVNSSAQRDTSTTESASNKAVGEGHFGQHDNLKSKSEISEESKGSVATPNSSLQDPNQS
ncbi:hypothetical protein RJT34_33345 [Clitoria ternatea]|uniref:Uncharacterized protein n=1 Tax=Clitoria ternatea TaxID=43366 RepID=A0AAN9EY15_CLITE